MNTTGRRAIAIEKSPGIFCPGEYDGSVTAIASPLQNYFGCMTTTNVPVIVDLRNPGLTAISNVPVSFSYDGGTPVNEIYPGSIAAGATVTYTFTATVNIGALGSHSIDVWTSYPSDIMPSNDTLSWPISLTNGTTIAPPYSENFESFSTCGTSSNCGATNCTLINGWFNVPNGGGDDIDWRTDEGGTPSSNTGPSNDYAPGTATGNYLYLEASACEYATAMAVSPCIDLTTFQSPTLLFGYHMFGSGMGSLRIDVYSNGAWINNVYVRNGSQSQSWLQASLPLTAYQGQVIMLRFRGVTGTGGLSDMAFDAVRVENVTSTPEYNAVNSVSVFPNPASGQFNFTAEGIQNENVTATVYDMTGRVVFAKSYGEQYGEFRSLIDLSHCDNGTYFMEISIGEAVSVTRLVKEE
jgi:hypothetical protein